MTRGEQSDKHKVPTLELLASKGILQEERCEIKMCLRRVRCYMQGIELRRFSYTLPYPSLFSYMHKAIAFYDVDVAYMQGIEFRRLLGRFRCKTGLNGAFRGQLGNWAQRTAKSSYLVDICRLEKSISPKSPSISV